MSANRRFFPSETDNGIVKFTIDTTKIVEGATDGSENPLTFKIPLNFPTNSSHKFIIRVNDGRSDVPYTPATPNNVLTFSTAGEYEITLIGSSSFFMGGELQDKLKWKYLDVYDRAFSKGVAASGFYGFSNLTFRFKETLKLSGLRQYFFRNTKGFTPDFNMNLIDVSSANSVAGFFSAITTPLYSALNPFLNSATTLAELYENVNMLNVPKIEIISPTVNALNNLLKNSQFQGELIVKAPIVSIFGMFNNITNPPSAGKVDVRLMNSSNGWINSKMSKVNVDSTLKGWVNNFDWSGVAVISRTVSFASSIYSNKKSVIDAKTFLESKGFTFTNLILATEPYVDDTGGEGGMEAKVIASKEYTVTSEDSNKLLTFTNDNVVVKLPTSTVLVNKPFKAKFTGNGQCEIVPKDWVRVNKPENKTMLLKKNVTTDFNYLNYDLVEITNGLYGDEETFTTPMPTATNLKSVVSLLIGNLTKTGIDIHVKLSAIGEQFATVYSDELMTNVVTYSDLATTKGYEIAKMKVRGLAPNTKYYYSVGTFTGQFNTMPSNSTFKILAGSCAGGSQVERFSNHEVFSYMAQNHKDALLLLHMGDFHYRDENSKSMDIYDEVFEQSIQQTNQQELYKNMPLVYISDDHDFCGNDSSGRSSGKFAHTDYYKLRFPNYGFPFPIKDYIKNQTFAIGGVRFIICDQRTNRLTNGQLIGSQQVEWIKNLLLNATEDMFVIEVGVNWIGTGSGEGWQTSGGEREDLMAFISENSLTNNVMFLAGDSHMLAYDDGTNNEGVPVFQISSFDSPGTIKGGPYSGGTFAGNGQFGTLEFTDNATDITMDFKGHKLESGTSSVIISYTKNFPKRSKATNLNFTPETYPVAITDHLSELKTIVSGLSFDVPTLKQQQAMNNYIQYLMDEGIWSTLDIFSNFAWNGNILDGNLLEFSRYNYIDKIRMSGGDSATALIPQGIIIDGTLSSTQNLQSYSKIGLNNSTLGIVTYAPIPVDSTEAIAYLWASSGATNISGGYMRLFGTNAVIAEARNYVVKKSGIKAVTNDDLSGGAVYNGDYLHKNYTGTASAGTNTKATLGKSPGIQPEPFSLFFGGSSLTKTQLDKLRKGYNKFLAEIGLEPFA